MASSTGLTPLHTASKRPQATPIGTPMSTQRKTATLTKPIVSIVACQKPSPRKPQAPMPRPANTPTLMLRASKPMTKKATAIQNHETFSMMSRTRNSLSVEKGHLMAVSSQPSSAATQSNAWSIQSPNGTRYLSRTRLSVNPVSESAVLPSAWARRLT